MKLEHNWFRELMILFIIGVVSYAIVLCVNQPEPPAAYTHLMLDPTNPRSQVEYQRWLNLCTTNPCELAKDIQVREEAVLLGRETKFSAALGEFRDDIVYLSGDPLGVIFLGGILAAIAFGIRRLIWRRRDKRVRVAIEPDDDGSDILVIHTEKE